MVTMTRRVTFSAALADWLPTATPEENRVLFGPTASPEPYGHNFVLDVAVRGDIDPRTGIIVNIKDIDRIVKQHVIARLDRKFINRQVEAFCEQPVTSENLLAFIRQELLPVLPAEVTLTSLSLEETPLDIVTWQADEQTGQKKERCMIQMTRVYEFAASHRLHSPHLTEEENRALFGKCNYEHGHGHNYILEVTVTGPTDSRTGRLLDPADLDAVVNREVVDRYDHRHFNYDIPEFAGLIPSTEVVTKMIWERLRDHIPAPARLHRVVVRETARNFFEYKGEDDNA